MNIREHLSKFEFSKKINDIAFKNNKNQIDVEKKYYFDLLSFFINSINKKINISSAFDYSDKTIKIDGYSLIPEQTLEDWISLASFLSSAFLNVGITFSYSPKGEVNNKYLYCVLYYTSLFDDKIKSISLSLFGSNIQEDSSSSTSGGTALEKTKLTEEEIKLLVKANESLAKNKFQEILISKTKYSELTNKNTFNPTTQQLKKITEADKKLTSMIRNIEKKYPATKDDINKTTWAVARFNKLTPSDDLVKAVAQTTVKIRAQEELEIKQQRATSLSTGSQELRTEEPKPLKKKPAILDKKII